MAGASSDQAPATAELRLSDLAATHGFGRRLAALLLPGDVVALRGTLGAGKTELARAVIRARAGAAIEVPSPTFTLVQDYALGGITIRHIDLYRIESAGEVVELGLEAPASDEVWLVEWPEHAGASLPVDRLDVTLSPATLSPAASPDARHLRLGAGPGWRSRLSQLIDDSPADGAEHRPPDRADHRQT